MKYQVKEEDVKLSDDQLQDLNDDRAVWDIFTKFDNVKYRVMSLKYLKTQKVVKLFLVRASFDFGDGYYTAFYPETKDKRYEKIALDSPQLKRIIDKINSEWENHHLDGLKYCNYDQEYIEAIHRRNTVHKAVAVLEEDIKRYRSFDGDKYDKSNWECEADYLEQLSEIIQRKRTINTLERKKSLRDIEREQEEKEEELEESK